jgi:uncharacterized membrane protein
MKRALWVVMTLLATLVAAYAAAVLLVPGFGPPFITQRRATMPLAVVAHLGGGLVALAVGTWQMNARLRDRVIELHRWMGRTYVIAVLFGGLGALRMAVISEEGWVTHFGFGLLALLWLFTTARAYVAIRAHEEARHRRWMIRSYSLTLAAVTLRIYLPLSLAAGIQFTNAYRVISWLCWVPNIILAEWVARHPQEPSPVAGASIQRSPAPVGASLSA